MGNSDFSHVALTSPYPISLEVSRAEGNYIYDREGKKYLDLIAGVAVSNIGHRHPTVVEAIKDQLDRYMHVMVYGEYVQSPQVKLSEKLCSLLPENLDRCYFVNSGTEANEAALKLAKRFTGRSEIISCIGAYHGSTHGSLSVTGKEGRKRAFRPLLPDVHFIRFGVEEDLERITEKTACIIIETIQGDAGVRIASGAYWKALRKKCDETGTLLILDEIQTGFGRTGKFFAFEHYNIAPDILTIAKAMGGGMPIGALVASHELMTSFTHDPVLGHITTFGGHPVNCASALANIEVILEEKLIETVEQKAVLFKEQLRHPAIQEIRSIGLMFAIQLKDAETVTKLFHYCLERGIICFWFLSCPDSLRIAPPLTITEAEVLEATQIILNGLDEVGN